MADKQRDEKIFLNYTQEELDWQYDHSKRFPDTGIFQEERGNASKRVREKIDGIINVPYGDHEDEVVDIFPTTKKKLGPVIVFFHGGAWTRGSKNGYSFPAEPFTRKGVSWVTTEFTKVPNGTLSNQVRQNRDAVAWVYSNADTYGWDRNKIYIAGHSSGGHMCGMVLITDWQSQYGLPVDLVKGATAISGMYDLEAVFLSYRNSYLNLSVEDWQENSAIRHVPKTSTSPLIIGCAEHDTAEFHRQPKKFLDAWKKAGHKGEFIELMDRHHFTGSMCFGEEEHPLFKKMCEMIGV